MTESEIDSAISKVVEAAVGIDIRSLPSLPIDRIEDVAQRIRERRCFENAVKDFLTIVLATPMLDGADGVRVLLAKCALTIPGAQLDAAMHASDADFERRSVLRFKVATETLRFLRATGRAASRTGDGQLFVLHGRDFPSKYEPEHLGAFERLVSLARSHETEFNDNLKS